MRFTSGHRLSRKLIIIAAAVAVVASACSSATASEQIRVAGDEATTTAPPTTAVPESTTTTVPVTTIPATPPPEALPPPETPVIAGIPSTALIAQLAGSELPIRAEPDGVVTATLSGLTEYGSPLAFGVVQVSGDWVQIWLQERPNGSTGWVQRGEVVLTQTTLALGADLASRTLTLYDNGVPQWTERVVIGRDAAPSPTGRQYITDLLETPNPGGAYGPFALGLSAHSDTFSEFGGSDGQVGIHGTSQPGLIGQAVSAGCLRLSNERMTELAGLLPLGTPVIVQ